MFKRILPLILTLSLLIGCGSTTTSTTSTDSVATDSVETTQIVATTYPVYILASALTAGLEDVTVTRLNTGDISCLHDYTLTVSDMKLIEGCDIIAMNGADLEGFMTDALSQSSATAIYCDSGIDLLYMEAHDHDHDHEEEEEHVHTEDCDHSEDDHDDHDHDHEDEEIDPHFWLDPALYSQMAATLSAQLAESLPQHSDVIGDNLTAVTDLLSQVDTDVFSTLSSTDFITFHDGFQYFSHAFGMNLLASIEEEAGSEASAQDIAEIIGFVNDYNIPAIFSEVNGSSATADAIARETGCAVYSLNMIMNGDDVDHTLSAQEMLSTYYLTPMEQNISTINEAMK